jgi:hypothetical protein
LKIPSRDKKSRGRISSRQDWLAQAKYKPLLPAVILDTGHEGESLEKENSVRGFFWNGDGFPAVVSTNRRGNKWVIRKGGAH